MVTDVAGNSGIFTSPAVKIDKEAPTVTFVGPTPAPNAAGWNNTDVTFNFTARDNLSGIESCSSPLMPFILSGERPAIRQSITCRDLAGNSASFTSPAVKIDKTPPVVQSMASP